MSNSASQNPVDWSQLALALVGNATQSKANDGTVVAAQIAEVCGAAFASGFTRGRWGKVELGGVPFDLGAGVLLHLLGWSGVAREQSRDLHHLAEGALATYFATLGASAGKRARQGEQVLPDPSVLVRTLNKNLGVGLNGSTSTANGSLPTKDGELLEFIRTIVPN